jgi:hypothetical protein
MQVGTNEMLDDDDARRLALPSSDARSTASSTSPRTCRTCSSHPPAYSTRRSRRLTGPRSSCASAFAADREDDQATWFQIDLFRRYGFRSV